MTPICPKCKIELKLIPTGISKKTGKPYNAFFSCPQRCGYTEKAIANPSSNAQNSPTPQQNGWAVVVEHLISLETKVEEMISLIKEQLSL